MDLSDLRLIGPEPGPSLVSFGWAGGEEGNYGWFKNSRIDTPGEGGCQLPRRV